MKKFKSTINNRSASFKNNKKAMLKLVKKLNGYDTPNYEGNAMLGYNAYAAGNFM